MLEFYIRPFCQTFLITPIAKAFKNFPPNSITAVACGLGILTAPALMLGFTRFAIFLLIISGLLDALDGTVARMTRSVTQIGSVLDIMSDRTVEFAVLFGLYAVDTQRAWLVLLMFGSCYLCVTSFLSVQIFTPNQGHKNLQLSPGIVERSEALILFMIMIALPNYFNFLACLFIGLVLLTAYTRISQFAQLRMPSSCIINREMLTSQRISL